MAGFFDIITSAFSDPETLNLIATGVDVGSKIYGASQQVKAGKEENAAAQFTAQQLRERAGDAEAAAQREAFFQERAAKIVMSNALAAAAASGGGASDPTVVRIIAGIAQEGAYRQQAALYQGQDRARVMRTQATVAEMEGRDREGAARAGGYASLFGAGTSLAKGMARDASLYQRFGNGGPQMTPAPSGGGSGIDAWWDGEDAY